MIKDAIKKIISGKNLSEDEMVAVMGHIMDGQATDAQIASFITALRMKGETAEELTGAARVMRQKALSIPVKTKGDLVDIVGTGPADSGELGQHPLFGALDRLLHLFTFVTRFDQGSQAER